MSSLSSYTASAPSMVSAPASSASIDEPTASLLPAFSSGVRWTTPKPTLLQSRRQSGGTASPALSATSAVPSLHIASTTSVSSSSSSTSSAASSTLTTPTAEQRAAPNPHSASNGAAQVSSATRVAVRGGDNDSKQQSPDLSFGDVSLDGDELFSDGEDEEDDERESESQEASVYSSPSAQPSPSEKLRLRNERRRGRSQLEMDRRTADSQSQSPHEIHTLNSRSHHSRHSFSASSSPQLSSQQHSRRSPTPTTAPQLSTAPIDLPLHDAQIAQLLLPLSTSLPLPTLHSRLSSLRSALHASHCQLTEYRSLLSDKQQQQADEKQINYELFIRVQEQDEHVQWLTHSLQQANSHSGSSAPSTTDGSTERLTLRGMRGVALHAAHMQLREMMGEVDKRANEIRRLEEQLRTLKIEKEARSEGDSNEIERLRQEVAVLMGKLAVEAEEREQRDTLRSKQERKVEKQLDKLKQQRQSLEHDLLQSTAEVNTLSSALSSLRQQHSSLTFDHQRLMDEKGRVEQEREGWRKRYEDVMDEVDTMRNEVRDAREVSDGIERLVEGSDSLELRRVRDECERKVDAMQEEVRAMERAVVETKRGMDAEVETRVEQQTEALHDELRQLRDEHENENQHSKSVVAAAQLEQEEAEAENEELRQRLRQLTQQLDHATRLNSATTSADQPVQPVGAEEKDHDRAGENSVHPSLLSVLRAELDSVRAINQRLVMTQQQAESSARTQLGAAHKQMSDLESRLHSSERREQELREELSQMQRRLEAQRQHKTDDEQKQQQEEASGATGNGAILLSREQQWQYERSQLLQSITALTAESKEREAVVSKLMDKIAVLEENAQRAARMVEKAKTASPNPAAAAAGAATLPTSANGSSAARSPLRPSSAVHSRSTAAFDRLKATLHPRAPSPASPAPSTPLSATSITRPVPLSPVAGELLSDSLLDQLASRLAAKLTHSEPAATPLTRPTATRHTTPAPSPARPRRVQDADEDGGRAVGGTAGGASSADIAAEMAAIYRQLEGKSRTFSHFAQHHAGDGGRSRARLTSSSVRSERRTATTGHRAEDDELKEEVEQDDYMPLIRRTVGGQASHTQPNTRRSPAPTVQPAQKHGRTATTTERVTYSSYAHSPTSSLLSSVSSSPAASSSSPSVRQPPLSSPPMSPCSLSPSLSSSAASSFSLSPPAAAARRATGASRVMYGGSVKLQLQQRSSSSSSRTR